VDVHIPEGQATEFCEKLVGISAVKEAYGIFLLVYILDSLYFGDGGQTTEGDSFYPCVAELFHGITEQKGAVSNDPGGSAISADFAENMGGQEDGSTVFVSFQKNFV
jgi:hypothetical protein